MAQIEERDRGGERLRLLARQRPGMMVAVALFAGSLLGAAAFGVVQANGSGGVEIERADAADGEEPGVRDDVHGEESDSQDDALDAGAADANGDEAPVNESSEVVVDVSGAVARPGVVALPEGSRVQDAIDKAGGLTGDADPERVNRAAKLADGQQVHIPRAGESDVVLGPSGVPDGAVGTADVGSGLVNINTATIDELDTLSGVGPATAQAIVEDRDVNGPFATIEDLMRVSGIGEKKFEKLKSSICV